MRSTDDSRRIAVIGPHFPFRGGIAHFTNRVCQQLESERHDVVRVSFSRLYPKFLFPGKTQYEPLGEGGEGGEGDRSRDLESKLQIDSINPLSWLSVARRLRQLDVDAIVFMYWMPFFAPAFSTIAARLKRSGVRILAVVHNALPHERHTGDRFLSTTFLNKMDAAVVLSAAVKKSVQELSPTLPVQVIPHPVYDHFGGLVTRANARAQLNRSSEQPLLLFFGLVRPYKGLSVLIDALSIAKAKIPDVHLIVAGEFYGDPLSIQEQISGHDMADAVTLINEYIPTERVPVLFGAADVVVQPYLTASQSGIVQAAFHFERAVIATDVGGMSEAVRNPEAGFIVPPGDADALADAIVRFFDPGVRERLERGARSIKEGSTWDGYSTFILHEIEAS
jgi:D-inositol-3-phosphate glycosyltransferase